MDSCRVSEWIHDGFKVDHNGFKHEVIHGYIMNSEQIQDGSMHGFIHGLIMNLEWVEMGLGRNSQWILS